MYSVLKMYKKKFNIAGIIMLFKSENPISDSKYYSEFYDNSASTPQYIFNIKRGVLPGVGVIVKDSTSYALTQNNRIFAHYPSPQGEKMYACLERQTDGEYLLTIDHHTLNDAVVFSTIDLYDILADNNKFILHSSCVIKDEKAILFSGRSGIGKSTQANLWEKYKDAELINGDRCIVGINNNIPYAYGVPMCGSSEVSKNRKYPIDIVAILGQSPENTVRTASGLEILQLLLQQTFIGPVYQQDPTRLFNLFNNKNFLNYFCIFQCRPDISAVNTLSQFIKEKGEKNEN